MDTLKYSDIEKNENGNLPEFLLQYLKIKKQNLENIVFFKIGEFWETYFDDAIILSRECNVKLTKRTLKSGIIPMAGIVQNSLNVYVAKLIQKGFKVAVCEQFEKGNKKIATRKVTRIYTIGTVFEDEFLNPQKSNYICAILKEKNQYGLSYCELSGGDFFVTKGNKEEIKAEIEKINPVEILISAEERDIEPFKVIEKPKADIDIEENFLENFNVVLVKKSYFSNSYIKEKNDNTAGLKCANAIISYIVDMQKEFAPKFGQVKYYEISNYLIIDKKTAKNLELTENSFDNTKYGSLFWAIDKTKTLAGKRLLKEWIKRPLKNIEEINLRQNAAEELSSNKEQSEKLKNILSECGDIKRLWGRLTNKSASFQDFLYLEETLGKIKTIKDILSNFKNPFLNFINEDYDILTNFSETLEKTFQNEENNFIKREVDFELDYFKDENLKITNWLDDYLKKQKEITGIKNLKIDFNKTFGYFLEVSNTNAKNIPQNYKIRQNLANSSRYTTDELTAKEAEDLNLKTKIKAKEEEILEKTKNYALEIAPVILNFANNLAIVDVLQSFCFLKLEDNFTKPMLSKKNIFKITNGFHPTVKKLTKNFTPNNFDVEEPFVILTGPNMGGKSTFLKQNAIIAILAQMGCYTSAEKLECGIINRIFTRMGTSEELINGKSSFMGEMLDIKDILDHAQKNSLILIDELGKGTSTSDGFALAFAISEYLIEKVQARTIFATHFHKLAFLEDKYPDKVANLMIGEDFNGILENSPRKIKRGVLSKSYGIKTAKIAGIKEEIIQKANRYVNF